MFLFIHDIGDVNSLWIPQIRSLLELNSSYSDRWIRDSFCLSIPGHGTKDVEFDLADLQKKVSDFHSDKLKIQEELAGQLIFSKNKSVLSALKSNRLTIIGKGLGGIVAINYASKNYPNIGALVLMNCGAEFNSIDLSAKQIKSNIVSRRKGPEIEKKIAKTNNIHKKTLYSIILEYPKRKGYISGIKILKEYNFRNYFEYLAITEQSNLAKLNYLCIFGKKDNNSSSLSSIKNLKNIIISKGKEAQSTLNEIKAKQTRVVIAGGDGITRVTEGNFEIVSRKDCGDNPMNENYKVIASDIAKFLELIF